MLVYKNTRNGGLDDNLNGFNMGGCQNDGPFLGPYYNTAPIS